MNKAFNNISKIIRKDILQMIHYAGSGHPGGALSSADIVTTLYFDETIILSEGGSRLFVQRIPKAS